MKLAVPTGVDKQRKNKALERQPPSMPRFDLKDVFSPVANPAPILPMVAAARARDAAARARLRSGDTAEDHPDFAHKIRTAELAGQRRRRR